jgi:undecaprenyl-diphosphatase
MDLLQAITLGLIQGTTEWLPVSSTGHLRITEHFFGLTVPLVFDVLLHFGTLLVTLIYFRGAIKNVLVSFWHRDFCSGDGRLIVTIVVGSVPTGLIAIFLGNQLDSYFSALPWLGVWFIVTGILLVATKFSVEKKDVISLPLAFLVGVMQGLSIIPSVSRSGFTIATMLLSGVKKEVAFKFSFLLSIPAIVGALGITFYNEYGVLTFSGISPIEIAASLLVTILVSFLALKLLEKALVAKKFYLFSIYCFIIGAAMFILSFFGF